MFSRQFTIDHNEWKYLLTSFEYTKQYSQVHECRDNPKIFNNKQGIHRIQENRPNQEETTLPKNGLN